MILKTALMNLLTNYATTHLQLTTNCFLLLKTRRYCQITQRTFLFIRKIVIRQSTQLVVALFSANNLLTELAIFADLRIYRAGAKKTYSGATPDLKQRTNSRWQSHVVVQLKQSLPTALLSTLHLIQQLESSELVRQSHKQLQFDI